MDSQIIRPEVEIAIGIFTATGSALFHEALIDDPSDADLSYVSVATNSTFIAELQNHGIPDDGQIVSIEFTANLRRASAGVNPDAILALRYGTTDYNMATEELASTSYHTLSVITTTHPATGAAWTPVNSRGLWVGVTYEGHGLPRPTMRVTQLYATVTYIPPTWTQKGISPLM